MFTDENYKKLQTEANDMARKINELQDDLKFQLKKQIDSANQFNDLKSKYKELEDRYTQLIEKVIERI